jgi:hypothetical protein
MLLLIVPTDPVPLDCLDAVVDASEKTEAARFLFCLVFCDVGSHLSSSSTLSIGS